MLQLFVPTSKVQKDRQIMRDTDARVAKYSRRGLVLNFIVAVSCLVFGDFFQNYQNLSIVLIVGLLLVTLLRAYYLFRFDTLYARAPARWRNQYFFASFLGAGWWAFILVSLTWLIGMRDETLIMWLYSVVFYSSVANVFAPYRRFLTTYLFIGQVPAALTAVLLFSVEGYLYGSIMLVFYTMLSHQAKVTSNTYWERLEANYALRERAKGLEFEQRSSKAAIELKNEFLVNLGQEFRSSLNDILGTLALVDDEQMSERHRELLLLASKAAERQLDLVNNVVDFSKITTKSLELEKVPFNLRRLLEKLVQDFALEAHQQGIELNYVFDQDLPRRVEGDATRLGQIFGTLMTYAVKHSGMAQIFVEAAFHPGENETGELQLVISDASRAAQEDDSDERTDQNLRGIGLSICKGLAECMGGSVNLVENRESGKRIVINVQLDVVAYQDVGQAEQRLRGKRILLVDIPEVVALDLVDQLARWGMKASRVYGHAQALKQLKAAADNDQKNDLVLIYNKLDSFDALTLSRDIAKEPSLSALPQVIAMSLLQRDSEEARAHLHNYPQVSCIEKPIMHRKLYETLVHRLLSHDTSEALLAEEEDDGVSPVVGRKVLLVEDQRVSQMVVSGMLKKLGCQVHVASNGKEALSAIEKEKFDLVLMDCDMPELDGIAATERIRESESSDGGRHLPVVAMTSFTADEDQARCRAAGMDDHISKPLRYEALQSHLEQWLGRGRD
ncbi:response regulator [Marinimicrobium sp. C6131]|uniref:response regulator n=1 Tax=Marinimicrobium sp. C6131 TaxID=3022676 RepID=UPI00223DB8C8|nr:response regulator [Marinimicrobium sp. C6131]UZJ45079.1 response regulator [Marinimicrobium sp. C6131]